jgi:hypothetical protein
MELRMAFFKVQTLQLALGAAVLSLAGMASAQVDAAKQRLRQLRWMRPSLR